MAFYKFLIKTVPYAKVKLVKENSMEQLNQNTQIEESLSLLDIVRLLLGKIKLLILVVIIGGILGASFAVWKTVDVNYFGTRVEFYVNPEKPSESTGTSIGPAAGGSQYGVYGAYGRHVMDNMVKLLSSDSFAEQLLLNGEKLPDMSEPWFGAEERAENGYFKNNILKRAVEAAQPYLDSVAEAEEAYNQALKEKVAAGKAKTQAETELNKQWRELYNQNLVESLSFDKDEYNDLVEKPQALKDAYSAFLLARTSVDDKTAAAQTAEDAWTLAQADASAPVEEALTIWRESYRYVSSLQFYKDAVSYSYLESDEDFEDANNLARSFIYVNISIQNSDFEQGTAIATKILERVKKVVPQYVADNMTVPDGYVGTNCQRITRTDDIRLTNPRYTTTQAIKYGILVAMAAFVVTAVIIIILDSSDKRLRDTEIIARKFNVPLLGIVPTIEELKAEQADKKKAQKSAEVK